ncbi:Putative glutamine amidotransferase PB2B2.05 [Geodia barretti]|uniref:Glutamine amidotransferase PB2B2.05 n=1 Tax=Geodia barretti TaxID=519541 RepID=A0AA35TU08_GEOBA|nr:Putative glutamine amidotransferase PB2B2.05 [Geodia barretti]
MQLLNIAFGGKASIRIAEHADVGEDGGVASAYHHIYIAPGSRLAAVVGSGGFVRVNSRHSNGIREAQKSSWLLASAYSLEDGVIEALESSRHRWIIGVQFRPERRMEVPPHFDRLFQSLLERAAERMDAAKFSH